MKPFSIAVTVNKSKEKLSRDDRTSLRRLVDLFPSHLDVIYIVGPKGMSFDGYKALGFRSFIEMAPSYFGSLDNYNRMMLSKDFYNNFLEYEYVLIHHPDAFLFRPDLKYWCDMGYHNIGAPWFEFRAPFLRHLFLNFLFSKPRLVIEALWTRFFCSDRLGGNGGLCLRHVTKSIDVLNKFPGSAEKWPGNEDYFWSWLVPRIEQSYQSAPFEECVSFSLEKGFKSNFVEGSISDLPMGCHGWTKYHEDVWRPIIRSLGYDA